MVAHSDPFVEKGLLQCLRCIIKNNCIKVLKLFMGRKEGIKCWNRSLVGQTINSFHKILVVAFKYRKAQMIHHTDLIEREI